MDPETYRTAISHNVTTIQVLLALSEAREKELRDKIRQLEDAAQSTRQTVSRQRTASEELIQELRSKIAQLEAERVSPEASQTPGSQDQGSSAVAAPDEDTAAPAEDAAAPRHATITIELE